jgi:hypothetical protein
VNELQFILEQNWGEVGWLLKQAKSIADVRNAVAKIVIQRCGHLEPFKDGRVRNTNPNELRALRKKIANLQERYRCNYARWQSAKEMFYRASAARTADPDPVKQAEIQVFLSDLGDKFKEADSLEQKSRIELEALRAQLRKSEAYFAQSEILRFIESNRRKFTPKNVACAMAGLPLVTARVSCERCAEFGINPSHGVTFEMFQTIDRMVPEPLSDVRQSIDALREFLLDLHQEHLPHAVLLRKDWYFLELAVRSAARDMHAPRGSLAFRIFAEYSRASGSQSNAEVVLAQANRLLMHGEEPELKRGPIWSPLLKRRGTCGTGSTD